MFADVLLENALRLLSFVFGFHRPRRLDSHYASVLIVSDQDFTDFHIVKELIDTSTNAIKPDGRSLPFGIDRQVL